MPSRASKVQKAVTKKKGSGARALHENSRDAQRLRRAGAKDDHLKSKYAARERINQPWVDRVVFFQESLPETLHPLSVEEMQSKISEYLARNDEELEQLKAERRAGRPPSTRQTMLEQAMKVERQEMESGFWMPNLQDEETLVKFEGWNRDWLGLGNLRFIRVDKNGVVSESAFPPRGAS